MSMANFLMTLYLVKTDHSHEYYSYYDVESFAVAAGCRIECWLFKSGPKSRLKGDRLTVCMQLGPGRAPR